MKCSGFARALLLGTTWGLWISASGCGGGGSSAGNVSLITVAVMPASILVDVGTTQQFTAVVTGTTDSAVTWSVNGVTGGSSTVGTISSTGLFTGPKTVPNPPTVDITATSQADPTRSGQAMATISVPAVTLSRILPIVAVENSPGLTLTARGDGFTPVTQVLFNGAAQPTTFVSPTQITAQIAPSTIATPGTFPVTAQTANVTSSAMNFYVVPTLSAQPVSASAGQTTSSINVSVQVPTPTFASSALTLLAVGVGSSAGGNGVELKPGSSATLFIVGQGVVAGTYYLMSGNPEDFTITQPDIADFLTTSNGTPAVNVKVSVSATAALGARNLVVTNPVGEISVLPGVIEVTQ